ncbi:MAG: hypothetical protein ACW97O_17640, partial [Candidatus Thorarchaeota archaeon]
FHVFSYIDRCFPFGVQDPVYYSGIVSPYQRHWICEGCRQERPKSILLSVLLEERLAGERACAVIREVYSCWIGPVHTAIANVPTTCGAAASCCPRM